MVGLVFRFSPVIWWCWQLSIAVAVGLVAVGCEAALRNSGSGCQWLSIAERPVGPTALTCCAAGITNSSQLMCFCLPEVLLKLTGLAGTVLTCMVRGMNSWCAWACVGMVGVHESGGDEASVCRLCGCRAAMHSSQESAAAVHTSRGGMATVLVLVKGQRRPLVQWGWGCMWLQGTVPWLLPSASSQGGPRGYSKMVALSNPKPG